MNVNHCTITVLARSIEGALLQAPDLDDVSLYKTLGNALHKARKIQDLCTPPKPKATVLSLVPMGKKWNTSKPLV